MALLENQYRALTNYLNTIYQEASKDAVAEMVGPTFFEVKESPYRTDLHQILHGVTGIELVGDGQTYPSATGVAGNSITTTQSHYAVKLPVSKDLRIFDRYDEAGALARTLIDEAWHGIDQSMADVLGNGFSSSAYTDYWGASVSATGPDALAVFSASHSNLQTSATFSNLMTYPSGTSNPALSREALVRNVQLGLTYTDVNGLNRPVRYKTLLVPPGLFDEAVRHTKSEQISGSNENDTNQFLRGMLEVKVWEKLQTRTGGTDTSAYWYLYDPKKVKEGLKVIFKQRPKLSPPVVFDPNDVWTYTLDFYYMLQRGQMHGIRGSTGAGS